MKIICSHYSDIRSFLPVQKMISEEELKTILHKDILKQDKINQLSMLSDTLPRGRVWLGKLDIGPLFVIKVNGHMPKEKTVQEQTVLYDIGANSYIESPFLEMDDWFDRAKFAIKYGDYKVGIKKSSLHIPKHLFPGWTVEVKRKSFYARKEVEIGLVKRIQAYSVTFSEESEVEELKLQYVQRRYFEDSDESAILKVNLIIREEKVSLSIIAKKEEDIEEFSINNGVMKNLDKLDYFILPVYFRNYWNMVEEWLEDKNNFSLNIEEMIKNFCFSGDIVQDKQIKKVAYEKS